jgi:hypothetical protein
MRITESRIKQIINEEARLVLAESHDDLPGPRFRPGSVKRPGIGRFASFEPPEGEWEPDPFDDFGGGKETGDPIEDEPEDPKLGSTE